ncbi:natural resistance-associated macrophage protein-domain-containing protein [Lentinula aff. detonsa]|uniref:Natural resistance-associated macrophage protein-domain-containing protein n=1 Tax=Lentinula aff. detonsa TaxID=2804958 RepID=A0AA38KPN7_9AGAR|nr:natural resistance-associated macrophage protein-domain-containing protein [Lentinula aff. detonsa]KAJ3793902.1 natural resistance-associated macrophage protein-domain-containing protein [Lentinula aff. detonsa]
MAHHLHLQDPPKIKWTQRISRASGVVIHHVRRHVGVGLVCSIAYFDPGNWGVDLQAGSTYGYRLLFVVLIAGLIAVFLQILASRVGCVTGLDLASHCRLLLHSHPKYPRVVRWLAFYPLYVLSEVAIISTDLAELLGSAMALCMLFPKLQLWQGVLITAADVIFLLALKDPLRGRPVRAFELAMALLVLIVLICMCIVISRVNVEWNSVFQGYLPSKYIFPNGAFYTSVGILGATVMPHSLFLGSALSTQDRESSPKSQLPSHPANSNISSSTSIVFSAQDPQEFTVNKNTPEGDLLQRGKSHTSKWRTIQPFRFVLAQVFRTHPEITYGIKYTVRRHEEWENNSFDFVKRHLYHGIVDVTGSLLGFAVVINSMILILSSAVFFHGNGSSHNQSAAGLFDAYDLIRDAVGQGAATLFAIALLAAGQSSSLIATIAGQAVAEGFLRWRVSPIVRRLFTRVIAIIPSMAVAIAFGRPGINALLVISQVILSIVLPFITLPLVYLTSSKKFMTVNRHCSCCPPKSSPTVIPANIEQELKSPHSSGDLLGASPVDLEEGHHSNYRPNNAKGKSCFSSITSSADNAWLESSGLTKTPPENVVDNQTLPVNADSCGEAIEAHNIYIEKVDYSNSLFVTILLSGVWIVIAAANVYAIVALAMGQNS